MKKMRKLIALTAAAAMTLAMSMTGLAATGDFKQTPDSTIEATNVTSGDTVSYYKLVEWSAAAGDWALTGKGKMLTGSGDAFLAATDAEVLSALKDGITEAEAAKIAAKLADASADGSMTEGSGKYTAEVVPGLYYLKATAGENNKATMYNPAFVSADYYEGGNSVDFSTAYAGSTVVKKSVVELEKEVNSTTDSYKDVKPGDSIPFKISATIPAYGSAFTNPQFTIEDTLSEGLELDGDVTVKYGDATTTVTVENVVTITKNGNNKFSVDFQKAYLTGLNGATPAVEITYNAKVTSTAPKNVNPMDNTAKLTFSNSPSQTSSQEVVTRHYTFSIDGSLLGSTGESTKTTELIKTGIDKDGNPITVESERVDYHGTKVSPLSGATFKLTGTGALTGVEKTASSTADGRINFTGLDAGTYELTETAAPAGYVLDPTVYTVTITPTYDTNITDLLKSYTIEIKKKSDNSAVGSSTFTMTNAGTVVKKTTASTDTDASTFLQNKTGAALPTTGGIGTTLFYVIGSILVIGAGLL
ncbi:MAG: isopeptide-forming domain-containing fimbrial protein, partial [Lachnospiraceae bacterium]|nr:isopeptide-forming domain-containing fimbrial protein [Lachnospiraceae bacterium]